MAQSTAMGSFGRVHTHAWRERVATATAGEIGQCGVSSSRMLTAVDNLRGRIGLDAWWNARVAVARGEARASRIVMN